jgi:hypothetical protein
MLVSQLTCNQMYIIDHSRDSIDRPAPVVGYKPTHSPPLLSPTQHQNTVVSHAKQDIPYRQICSVDFISSANDVTHRSGNQNGVSDGTPTRRSPGCELSADFQPFSPRRLDGQLSRQAGRLGTAQWGPAQGHRISYRNQDCLRKEKLNKNTTTRVVSTFAFGYFVPSFFSLLSYYQ